MSRNAAAIVVGLILGCAIVLFFTVHDADAHPGRGEEADIPFIHKVWCPNVGLFCRDRAAVMPKQLCTWERRGIERIVFDPKLGAKVLWQCYCENEVNCHWRRVRIIQGWMPWDLSIVRTVTDFHRRCASIVCKFRPVPHRYRVWVYPL